MYLSFYELSALALAFFGVATIYSAAGFGGGSSYLALLTFAIDQPNAIRTLALACNLTVVLSSVILLSRKGNMPWRTTWPIVLASIPLAFLGASIRLPTSVFYGVLGGTLMIAAIAMLLPRSPKASEPESHRGRSSPLALAATIGAAIGFLSGLVGIGGGIFLSPVLNVCRYDTAKRIAAIAAFYILVNSAAGLAGLAMGGRIGWSGWQCLVLVMAVFAGGQLGTRCSLNRLNSRHVQWVTAAIVWFAGVRLLALV